MVGAVAKGSPHRVLRGVLDSVVAADAETLVVYTNGDAATVTVGDLVEVGTSTEYTVVRSAGDNVEEVARV